MTLKTNTFTKVYDILTAAERRKAWLLLVLMIVGMLLETLGVGVIIPAITLMMQSDMSARYPSIMAILFFFGNPSQTQLITFAMLGLVTVYFFKSVFLAFLVWKQMSFAFDVQANLSQRLFTNYLRQPYTFHLQHNSSKLIRNVTSEVSLFTAVITSGLLLITESLVLVGIFILLVIVEPLGALVTIVTVGGAAWIFYRFTRTHISNWGVERQHHEGLRIQHLQQGLGGAKDVKLLGREDDFLAQFSSHNIKSTQVWKLHTTLQNIPRLMFELLAVVGLAVLVISMIGQGRDSTDLIPILGLFAAAAFRLMPSINRVLASLQTLRYSLPVVNILYDENQLLVPNTTITKTSDSATFKSEINLKEIIYSYPNSTNFSLNGVSLTIKKGEFVGFIGPSGSGKSTLIDVLLGLLTPKSGKLEVDKHDVQKNMRSWQNQIGYVPQSIYLTDDTLRRNVAFGLPEDQIDDLAVRKAIKSAQLEEFVSSLPSGDMTFVGERGIKLSGGQRQRIGIARALYHDPQVLVLDEATSALDNATEIEVMHAISKFQGSKTIIVVAHRLSTVANCDRIFRLEKGKVVKVGSSKEMLN